MGMNEDQYYRIVGAFWRALEHSEKSLKLHVYVDSKTVVIEDGVDENMPNFYAYIDDHTSRVEVDQIIFRLYQYINT